MKYQFCLFKRRKHHVFHDLELNHLFAERIEHENQVIIVRRIIFCFEQMSIGAKKQFRLFLNVFNFRPFRQLIDKHFWKTLSVYVDVNDHIVLVLNVRDILEVLTVEFYETKT